MKHWALKLGTALGIVTALGYWRHERERTRRTPWPRERVNDAYNEVEALSDWSEHPDRRTGTDAYQGRGRT
jgi:hypothetical protein